MGEINLEYFFSQLENGINLVLDELENISEMIGKLFAKIPTEYKTYLLIALMIMLCGIIIKSLKN